MTEVDIDRIVINQGYVLYTHDRNSTRGDGTSKDYAHLHKPGMRRPIYLGAMTKLTEMSEADLVALIKTKTAKSAQFPAQKGEE